MRDYTYLKDKIQIQSEQIFDLFGRSQPQLQQLSSSEEQARELLLPLRELLLRGGKRWRGISALLLASHFTPQIPERQILTIAALVEIVHASTLMIDDIEDYSPLRRGEKASYLLYGKDTAVNCGNLGYFLPFIQAFRELGAEQRAQIYEIYFKAMHALHVGQGLDIKWHRLKTPPERSDYLIMTKGKTASIALMAVKMALTFVSSLTEPAEKALLSGIENVAVGFQIIDDYKNLVPGELSKSFADDVTEGKMSYPLIWLASEKPQLWPAARKLLEPSVRSSAQERAQELADLLRKSGALEATKTLGSQLIAKGLETLRDCLPPAEGNGDLPEFLQSLLPIASL